MNLFKEYLFRYKKLIFLALLLGTINQVFSLLDPQIFRLIFVLIYAFIVHWLIALSFIILIPFLAVIVSLISKKIKTAQTSIVKETSNLAGSATETLRNVELV